VLFYICACVYKCNYNTATVIYMQSESVIATETYDSVVRFLPYKPFESHEIFTNYITNRGLQSGGHHGITPGP
jgi:hypothetical protein